MKSTLSIQPGDRERRMRRYSRISLAIVLIPVLEYLLLAFRGGPPAWLSSPALLVDGLWLVSAVVGLGFAIRACGLADLRTDTLALTAVIVQVICLAVLGMLTLWSAGGY